MADMNIGQRMMDVDVQMLVGQARAEAENPALKVGEISLGVLANTFFPLLCKRSVQ